MILKEIPVIDLTKCSKCGECIAVCSKNAIIKSTSSACSKCVKYCISMQVPCNPDNIIFEYNKCDFCGVCLTTCQQNAIYWHKPTMAL